MTSVAVLYGLLVQTHRQPFNNRCFNASLKRQTKIKTKINVLVRKHRQSTPVGLCSDCRAHASEKEMTPFGMTADGTLNFLDDGQLDNCLFAADYIHSFDDLWLLHNYLLSR